MNLHKHIADLLKQPLSLQALKAGPGKVRTRLTPAGWGFIGLILCGFLMAVNFSNNLIFAMTALLVSIALVGWYHTRVNLSGLAVADWRTDPVFAGQKAIWRLTVENRRPHGRHGLRAVSAGGAGTGEKHLNGGEQGEMTLQRQAAARGLIKPAPAHVGSCFPLGICEARLITRDLPECLVYPRPEGSQPIPDQAAGQQAHLLSESGTYTDMRRYAPGDPLSRISWKAFARFDELYTREFDGAQGRPALWLRWDDVRAGGTEQKLSQLCRWVLDAHSQNREYGLELPGTKIDPAGEETHLRRCLQALALYGETEGIA
jgi:uncharacterized protein (DUF58 family)